VDRDHGLILAAAKLQVGTLLRDLLESEALEELPKFPRRHEESMDGGEESVKLLLTLLGGATRSRVATGEAEPFDRSS
jgi:hypothetical protein